VVALLLVGVAVATWCGAADNETRNFLFRWLAMGAQG